MLELARWHLGVIMAGIWHWVCAGFMIGVVGLGTPLCQRLGIEHPALRGGAAGAGSRSLERVRTGGARRRWRPAGGGAAARYPGAGVSDGLQPAGPWTCFSSAGRALAAPTRLIGLPMWDSTVLDAQFRYARWLIRYRVMARSATMHEPAA